jgi:hypothetical protein
VVLDDKGGEIIYKDVWNMVMKGKESIKILKHTSRGSKLIDLYVAFECELHMFACIAQVSFLQYLLVWCMLVVGLNNEMKN